MGGARVFTGTIFLGAFFSMPRVESAAISSLSLFVVNSSHKFSAPRRYGQAGQGCSTAQPLVICACFPRAVSGQALSCTATDTQRLATCVSYPGFTYHRSLRDITKCYCARGAYFAFVFGVWLHLLWWAFSSPKGISVECEQGCPIGSRCRRSGLGTAMHLFRASKQKVPVLRTIKIISCRHIIITI